MNELSVTEQDTILGLLRLGAHLDPDMDRDAISREPGWQPLFGQVDAARSHLINQGVQKGDLFLMFGWFSKD